MGAQTKKDDAGRQTSHRLAIVRIVVLYLYALLGLCLGLALLSVRDSISCAPLFGVVDCFVVWCAVAIAALLVLVVATDRLLLRLSHNKKREKRE